MRVCAANHEKMPFAYQAARALRDLIRVDERAVDQLSRCVEGARDHQLAATPCYASLLRLLPLRFGLRIPWTLPHATAGQGDSRPTRVVGFAKRRMVVVLSPFALQGQLVRLEPLESGHAAALAEAAAENRASYGFTWVPDGLADARRYVANALDYQATGHAVPFVVRRLADERLVGATKFLDLAVFTWPPPWPPGVTLGPEPSDEQPPSVAEIGSTWYAASAQRTGVNAECKLLMLTHAFDVWHALRVTLKTDARNKASRGAIERLGARSDGVLRAHSPASDGTIRDTAYYSVLAEEWPEVRADLRWRLARLATP
jgi:N-acetyltransferase